MEQALRRAVEAAAGRADVGTAVRSVYDAVDVEIGRRRPTCDASGRCCRFEEYGHRLYVTTLELAAFLNGRDEVRRSVAEGGRPSTASPFVILHPSPSPWDATGCPFQEGKLCGVHAIRPFGCRMFFCDPTSTDWQNDAYERFHGQLKQLHQTLGVPYFYVEWRQALRAMGWATPDVLSGPEGSF